MQLQVREKDNRSVWYNTVTGTFIVSSPSCSVQRDKYNGAIALYNSWIDSDEEKESKNVSIELTNNNVTITDANEKENKTMENITLDKINEMIGQYVQQEVGKVQVNEEEIIDNYLCLANIENIIHKLEKSNLLEHITFYWEERVLKNTDFESVKDLILEYDDLKSQYDEMKNAFDDIYYSAQEIVDSSDAYR